jgi:hypothetical protein
MDLPKLLNEPEPELEAKNVLLEEANQLSVWAAEQPNHTPHRVKLAISREIDRLRKLAISVKFDPKE